MSRRDFLKRGVVGIVAAMALLLTGCGGEEGDEEEDGEEEED